MLHLLARTHRSVRACMLLALVLLAGCDNPVKKPEAPAASLEGERIVFAKDSPQLAALVSTPVQKAKASPLRLNGRLIWDEDVTVRLFTPFTGRVERILVRPGDHVRRGQTLATVGSPDFGQAQADSRRAAADFALAQQNLNRMRELAQHGVSPQKDLNAAEADYHRAQAELQRTGERLKLYGAHGNSIDQLYALSSPLAGVVVEKNINPGQELRPDQMLANAPALFVVTDPTRLWILLDATERDLPLIRRGTPIAVKSTAYPEQSFEGRITHVADFLDPVTRTIKVRGTLPNPASKLKAEMFVTAEIDSAAAPGLRVPVSSVFLQGDKRYVFVDEGEGRFVRREVEAGTERNGLIAIVGGVEEGERVVSDGALLLQTIMQPQRVRR